MSRTTVIARNTLMLYIRQILILGVSLYTVRVVLITLGVEDFGIYKVVAGFVTIFSFMNSAMISATQRFLNFAIGQNDTEQAKNVYSSSIVIYFLIAVFFIVIAETIGLWFFFNFLNIPTERQNAALITYQLSVVTTSIYFFRTPYSATIIAYEKMSFFAFVSILEVILKLFVAFLISIIIFDKLIFYSFLVFLIGIIVLLIYKFYCNSKFEIANFHLCKNIKLYQQLAEFSGWNFFGLIANTSSSQGINIVINIFYGVIINASMGIAMQIRGAVYSFVENFQIAFRPQIVKSYAAHDYSFFMRLIFQTSKASFYLLFLIVLPLYINADFVLHIWLKEVPEYTVIFTRLILLVSLLETFAAPLWMAISATGDIKKYLIIESIFTISNLPISYFLLYLHFSPSWVLLTNIFINIFLFVWRILFVSKRINLQIKKYLHDIIIPILIIVTISSTITFLSNMFFINWTKLILSTIISLFCTVFLIYLIGINTFERSMLLNYVKEKVASIKEK